MQKTADPAERVSIGAIARACNVDPETIRVWERLGRIPAVPRTAGGHRRYSTADLAAIQRACGLGATSEATEREAA